MCQTPKVGTRYAGTVKSIRDLGVFIEILPGVEGLSHISELADGFASKLDRNHYAPRTSVQMDVYHRALLP